MEFTRAELYLLLNQAKPLWLAGADLSGADLNGAKYNQETKWPDGFDPIEAGAKLLE
jgi:hypothetical protein